MSERRMKCKCGYEWTFRGKRKHSATCPDCKGQVKIPKEEQNA